MKNRTLLFVGVGVLLGFIFLAAMSVKKNDDASSTDVATQPTATTVPAQPNQPTQPEFEVDGTDPLNTSYTIEGSVVTLVDGESSVPAAPGSASMVTTSIFGVPVYGDVNEDTVEDSALMLVQESGGSGTFYYVAVAIQEGSTFQGSNGVLLGDSISPQNIQITEDGMVIANYAKRAPTDPMTADPSIGVSTYMRYVNGELVEVPAPVNE